MIGFTKGARSNIDIKVGDVIDIRDHTILPVKKNRPEPILMISLKSATGKGTVGVYADVKYSEYERVRVTKILYARRYMVPGARSAIICFTVGVELEDAGDAEPNLISDTQRRILGENATPDFTYGVKKDAEEEEN